MSKDIYILLTRTGTMVSNTVKLYTRKPFNHVSISLDEELNELYSFGRKIPWNPLIAGFIQENIFYGTYARFPDTTCEVYKYSVDKDTWNKIRQNINFFKEQEGIYRYNLIGLFCVMLNKPLNREKAFFCSQFVSHIFVESGLELFDKNIGLMTPDDFRHLEGFDLIYEGDLLDYAFTTSSIPKLEESLVLTSK
ncbi:hypothetical protein RZN22_11680 [Bacillaceae bacterium S4-13-58]